MLGWLVLAHPTVCAQGQLWPSVSEQPATDGERQAEEIEWDENEPSASLKNDSIFHCCERVCGAGISASFLSLLFSKNGLGEIFQI